MRTSAENGVTRGPSVQCQSLFSPISNRAPVLCLVLPSTPRLYAVRDQAPGSTSLLSFISDVAPLPDLLPLRDCGFDPFRPSAGGSHRAMAGCWPHPGTFAGPCCRRHPETVAGCQPAPEKAREIVEQQRLRDCGKSQHTSGTWLHPKGTLFQHRRMCLFSQVHWGLAFGGPSQPQPGVLPAGEPPLPVWPEDARTSVGSWGFALPTRAPPG
ncbi:uncharacterized protein LOC123380752 [Felis catus]|uniref:uncharacterized protein LOC123380752 n=1 Tax=Felis catus TaxID=9685 RepID=UPI001D1A1B2F|nr:uncharacterized protein LOC123380752 [Felis catus]